MDEDEQATGGPKHKRGRAQIIEGDADKIQGILAEVVAGLEPGDSLPIEILRFLSPSNLLGILVRPGKRQKETIERLGGGAERRG